MSYLEEIAGRFPIRRKAEQKKAFRDWTVGEIRRLGYSVKVEQNGNHENIVVGNPEKAPVLFTAHYDTPGIGLMPNLMLPRNPVLFILYAALNVVLLLLIASAVMLAAGGVTGNPNAARIAWIVAYFGMLLWMNYGSAANKNNVNDNTSGVATLLTMMAQLPPEARQNAAFILFDDEEKGMAGSKAYVKDHQQVGYTRMAVNLDCVGVGENILVISRKLARQHREYAFLEKHMRAITGRQVHFFDTRGSVSNSDWKSFKCGIAVLASKKAPIVGFYTPHVHTKRDTFADEGSITAIADALTACVAEMRTE